MGSGDRWLHHEADARKRNPRRANWHKINIIRQIQAVGADVPKAKWLEGLSREEALIVERAFVDEIGRGAHGPLANLVDGGSAPPSRDPHVRQKISAALSGRRLSEAHKRNIKTAMAASDIFLERVRAGGVKRRGRPLPEDVKQKIREVHTGKTYDAERRANIAAGQRRSPLIAAQIAKLAEFNRGKKASDETRAKQRRARRAWLASQGMAMKP